MMRHWEWSIAVAVAFLFTMSPLAHGGLFSSRVYKARDFAKANMMDKAIEVLNQKIQENPTNADKSDSSVKGFFGIDQNKLFATSSKGNIRKGIALLNSQNIDSIKSELPEGGAMEIRKICRQDIRSLKTFGEKLRKSQAWNWEPPWERLGAGAGSGHAFVLASEEGIKGFLSIRVDHSMHCLEITSLLASDDCGMFHKRQLLEKAARVAAVLGYNKLMVTLSEEDRSDLEFFRQAGFNVITRRPNKLTLAATLDILRAKKRLDFSEDKKECVLVLHNFDG